VFIMATSPTTCTPHAAIVLQNWADCWAAGARSDVDGSLIDHRAIDALIAEGPSDAEVAAILGALDAMLDVEPLGELVWPRCSVCDAEMKLMRRDAVFCSTACKHRARRARLRGHEEV